MMVETSVLLSCRLEAGQRHLFHGLECILLMFLDVFDVDGDDHRHHSYDDGDDACVSGVHVRLLSFCSLPSPSNRFRGDCGAHADGAHDICFQMLDVPPTQHEVPNLDVVSFLATKER